MDYKKIIRNRETRLKIIKCLSWVPDRPYLKMVYRIKTGRKLNLNDPRGFNEKINWLKLYDIRDEYTNMVDKILVREYIFDRIGGQYLIPLLGAWDHFSEIDFDKLPNEFVLKCNHDSGSVKIIHDKNEINKKELETFFEKRLKINSYCLSREYPYRKLTPRILAEVLMKENDESAELKDYKFYCFNGEPKFLYLSEGLSNHDTARINYVTLDWKKADFKRNDFKEFEFLPEKPVNFDEMIRISKILADGIPFVRVDLYEIVGKIYFGEITFFPAGGYSIIEPYEWELRVGDMLILHNN